MSRAAEVERPAPSTDQLRYMLRCGSRFTLGYAGSDVRQTAAVISEYVDWLEFEFEGPSGKSAEPRKYIGVSTAAFRASILAELPQLSTREAEDRGYR